MIYLRFFEQIIDLNSSCMYVQKTDGEDSVVLLLMTHFQVLLLSLVYQVYCSVFEVLF